MPQGNFKVWVVVQRLVEVLVLALALALVQTLQPNKPLMRG